MRRFLISLLFVALAQGFAFAADSPLTFYVQLVRGNNDANPPASGAKLIGPNLAQRLNPVFKWTNYWEIKRETVELEIGKAVRKRLSPEREVELEISKSQELIVRIFRNGKPAREMHQSVSSRFFIAGGDKEEDQSWFIVVRRDKPPEN